MFCPNCGTENPAQGKFCKSCGNPLSQEQTAPTVQPDNNTQPEQKKSHKRGVLIAIIIILLIGILTLLGIIFIPKLLNKEDKPSQSAQEQEDQFYAYLRDKLIPESGCTAHNTPLSQSGANGIVSAYVYDQQMLVFKVKQGALCIDEYEVKDEEVTLSNSEIVPEILTKASEENGLAIAATPDGIIANDSKISEIGISEKKADIMQINVQHEEEDLYIFVDITEIEAHVEWLPQEVAEETTTTTITTTTTEATTTTTTEPKPDPMTIYAPVLDFYYNNIQAGWQGYDPGSDNTTHGLVNDTDYTRISAQWVDTITYGSMKTLEEVCYQFIDINDDGTDELVIDGLYRNSSSGGIDFYTYYDGQIVHLCSAYYRTFCYVTSDHAVRITDSAGPQAGFITYYHLENGRLVPFEAFSYEAPYDGESTYKHTNTFNSNNKAENMQPITGEEYHAQGGHELREFDMIPFTEYKPLN